MVVVGLNGSKMTDYEEHKNRLTDYRDIGLGGLWG